VANTIDDQTVTEDSPFSFQVPTNTFTDVDAGDSLTYTAKLANGDDLPSWLSFDAATRTFSGIPTNGDVAALSIKVTASDRSESVSDIFDITVGNSNDAPTVTNPIADKTATEDQAFLFQFASTVFADVDGDKLSYTAKLANGDDLPSWLSFDAATRTFSGIPTNGDVAALSLKVTASDGSESVSDTFDITVANTNDAPKGKNKTITIKEDKSYTFKVSDFGFADASGESDNFSGVKITSLPSNGKFLLSGVAVKVNAIISADDIDSLSWTPAKNANGKNLAHFNFKVIDDGSTDHGGVNMALTANKFIFNVTEVTDFFIGDKKANTFKGTADHDVLDGKGGNDKLTGRGGSDAFIFGNGYGRDTITDFDGIGKDHDIINLSKVTGIDSWKDLKANHLSIHGDDIWITGNKGDVLVLLDVDKNELSKDDFIF
jgi:Ca2+-binding RTX toxin-like protein